MNTLSWEQILTVDRGQALLPFFEPLTNLPIVIIVGLTGVGKTTALTQLDKLGADFTLLPNRRVLADEVIIASLQKEAGELPCPVTDRVKRFDYTARYRAKHPGGMAFALSRLALNPLKTSGWLVFDGLRGLEEIQQATWLFKESRFVVLDAPDTVRLTRLLKRGDAFDQAGAAPAVIDANFTAALNNIPHIESVFTPHQIQQISLLQQTMPPADIIKKVTIIIEERRNYDSNTARIYLTNTLPPRRLLVVDTASHWPGAVAKEISRWLES